MPVKNAAMSGEMPLLPTLEATEANDLPGPTSTARYRLAQCGGGIRVVVADSGGRRQRGEEGVVGLGSALCGGAATVTAAATPTSARTAHLRFALFTVATLVYSGHIDNTVR